jgi:predicted secreted protein
MAAIYGKDVLLKCNGSTVICFRTISATFDGDEIDLSDSCSGGFKTFAKNPALSGVTFAVSGLSKTTFLRNAVMTPNGRLFTNCSLEWPGQSAATLGTKITGDFYLADYSEDMPYDNVLTFSGTLKTSGPYVYIAEGGPAPAVGNDVFMFLTSAGAADSLQPFSYDPLERVDVFPVSFSRPAASASCDYNHAARLFACDGDVAGQFYGKQNAIFC